METAAAGDTVRASSSAVRILQSFVRGEPAPLRRIAIAIALLTILRFALGAYLPLAFDEAYYWLWSKHLALSYFDHPPAIAYAIKFGTLIFGDTSFGVRAAPLFASVLASWAVWRSASLLLENAHAAARACLYFNLTLMVAVETMAATPDALELASAALLFLALAKLVTTDDGRWWLAVGASGGLCLLSKYTGFFLGAGIVVWALATSQGRKWLSSPWFYLGGLLALAMFTPVVVWNAEHDWISFRFQFGRVASGDLTLRFFAEFLLAQLALASPFILVLGVRGFVRASDVGPGAPRLAAAAILIWPAVAYFVFHATHDRVQGNWPSFVYPAFALLAAYGAEAIPDKGIWNSFLRLSRGLAVPVAAIILVLVYAQAFFGLVPARDPIARLTAIGFEPVAGRIEEIAHQEGARAIVTTNYATTAWLDFYLKPKIPVVQVDESFRWLSAPAADSRLSSGSLLLVTTQPKKAMAQIAGRFSRVDHVSELERRRGKAMIEKYEIYRVSGWRNGVLGYEP